MMRLLVILGLLLTVTTQEAHAVPVLIAAVAGAGGAMIAAGSMAITGQVIGMALLNGVLAGASMLLQKKPNVDFGSQAASRTVTGMDPTAPRQLIYGQTQVGGVELFLNKTGTSGEYLHIIIALAGHECEGIEKIYFDNVEVPLDTQGNSTGRFGSTLRVKKHLGADNQAADPDLLAECPTLWDTTCTLSGICYLYVRLTFNNSLYPNGIPNITALVKGKKVYDPRTGTTAWSENPALCLRDYFTDTRFGLKVPASQINEDSFIEAANICEEAVALEAGGTEKRYTCNGVLDSGVSPEESIARIRTAMSGTVFFSGGQFYCHAGAWRLPLATGLSEKDARANLTVQTNLALNDIFNAFQGQYVSPANNYQPADYPVVKSEQFLALDGAPITYDYTLAMTNSATMAQRLAKIELLRVRQPITVVFKANLKALQYIVGDVIPVGWARFGWQNKYFEVISLQLTTDSDESSGAPLLGVDLTLRETAAAIYDWTTDEESPLDLAPNTNLPSPLNVPPPSSLGAQSGNSQLYVKNDGTVASRVLLAWTPPSWATVKSGGYYNVQYKRSSDTVWSPSFQVTGDSSSVYISDVKDGTNYDFRVSSVSALGVQSEWATLSNYTVLGKTAPPSSPTNFNVVVQPDGTRLFSWIKPADLDFSGCLIAYSTNLSHTFDQMSLINTGVISASPFECNQLSAGTYAFGLVSVDTSGNRSTPVYIIGAVLPNPRIAGAIAILNPDQVGWPGTYTNCHKDNNNYLEPACATRWNDLTTWDNFTNWLAGATSPISYTYGPYDIGVVTQFTPLVTCVCLGTPTYQIKISQDGTNWTGWLSINSVYQARYIQIKIQVEGATPLLQSAQIILSGTPKTEIVANLNTANIHSAVGVFRVPLTKSYKVITSVNVMLLSVGAGWSAVVMDKNATSGPLINIYNGNNALADCAVDIAITGL